jgi:hypothetical protein
MGRGRGCVTPAQMWGWMVKHAGALTLALVLVSAGIFLRSSHQPAPVPPKLQKTIDSLAIVKPIEDHRLDSLKQDAARSAKLAEAATKRAELAQASAEIHKRRADSLAKVAASRPVGPTIDSAATEWHRAYDERTTEAEGLRRAVAEKDDGIVQLNGIITDLRLSNATLAKRDTAQTAVIIGLQAAVTEAGKCRIALGIPCPSRPVSYALGAATAVLGVVALHRP